MKKIRNLKNCRLKEMIYKKKKPICKMKLDY